MLTSIRFAFVSTLKTLSNKILMTLQFFLKGTQLSQLSDEYDICMENINTTSKVLSQKRTALPDLKEKRDAAAARLAEASKALEQKKKADDLKKELAWAHVGAKEAEMGEKMREVASAESRLAKTKTAETKAQVCIIVCLFDFELIISQFL